MKKFIGFMAALMLMTTPVSVLAEKSPTTKNNGGGYDGCATDNIALAAKGCTAYVNGQWLTSNGDGTVTTQAGNVLDSNGNLIRTNGNVVARAGTAVPNTGDVNYSVYYMMFGGALIVMAGAGYILYTNKH